MSSLQDILKILETVRFGTLDQNIPNMMEQFDYGLILICQSSGLRIAVSGSKFMLACVI